jgi:uncharacterized membrane protein
MGKPSVVTDFYFISMAMTKNIISYTIKKPAEKQQA